MNNTVALTLCITLLMLGLPGLVVAAEPAAPPKTRIEVVTDRMHGADIPDPYRWLEDQESPETRPWITAQNAYARTTLDAVAGRDRLRGQLARMTEETFPAELPSSFNRMRKRASPGERLLLFAWLLEHLIEDKGYALSHWTKSSSAPSYERLIEYEADEEMEAVHEALRTWEAFIYRRDAKGVESAARTLEAFILQLIDDPVRADKAEHISALVSRPPTASFRGGTEENVLQETPFPGGGRQFFYVKRSVRIVHAFDYRGICVKCGLRRWLESGDCENPVPRHFFDNGICIYCGNMDAETRSPCLLTRPFVLPVPEGIRSLATLRRYNDAHAQLLAYVVLLEYLLRFGLDPPEPLFNADVPIMRLIEITERHYVSSQGIPFDKEVRAAIAVRNALQHDQHEPSSHRASEASAVVDRAVVALLPHIEARLRGALIEGAVI